VVSFGAPSWVANDFRKQYGESLTVAAILVTDTDYCFRSLAKILLDDSDYADFRSVSLSISREFSTQAKTVHHESPDYPAHIKILHAEVVRKDRELFAYYFRRLSEKELPSIQAVKQRCANRGLI
jgi:hypothetical protein